MVNNNLLFFIQGILPIPLTIAVEIDRHFKEIEFSKNYYLVQEGKVSDEYVFL
jgi:hypothetical protein